MILKSLIFSCQLFLICLSVSGQQKKINIQEVSIKDTFLLKQLKMFINLEEDTLFRKGIGYVILYPDLILRGDTIIHYYINKQYSGFELYENDIYPPFYSYVENRLIFIRALDYNGFLSILYSQKSKQKLRKKLKPFLQIEEFDFPYTAKNGKVKYKKGRDTGSVNLKGGFDIVIFKNGTPLVKRNIHGQKRF